MKAFKKVVAMLAICTMMAVSISGCGDSGEEKTQYTITFMNGKETLGTVKVAEGETVSKDEYSKFEAVEGFQFIAWYETPGYLESSEKDLTKDTFTKDTTLYGCFKNANVAEDTRVWYLAGTSDKGILKLSNWAAASVDDASKEQLKLSETGENTNEFSITIDLFAGDQFQVIHDWAWDDQKGYGCFTTIDETQIESGGGLGGSAETANSNVLVDGNYTITLTTDPENSAMDTMVVVRNSDPLTQGSETPSEAPFVATEKTTVSVKGSWVADWSELKELTKGEGNIFTISMELTANTELCFSVFDDGTDTGIVLKGSNVKEEASKTLLVEGDNIVVAADGTYNFTVNLNDMTVVVTK